MFPGYGEAVSILPVRLTSNDEGAVFRCEASYPDYNNALNANLTTALSGKSMVEIQFVSAYITSGSR